MVMTVEAVGLTIWLLDRTERERRRPSQPARDSADIRYLYLVSTPALLVALLLGFGFGYLAGGSFWGLYTAALTVGFIAVSEYLVWRR